MRLYRPPPLLGQHNAGVFCGALGYAPQGLVILRRSGVI
jgi:hypothetical protein